MRAVAPQPLAPPAGDPRRGAFVEPGDYPVESPEFRATVHVNAAGFVDREWGPKRPGVPRVLVLGDSFVQAAQVDLDAGFGRQVERRTAARLQQEVEVLSLGVPGAGTATALHLWREVGAPLQPDLVVLGFLVANDVFNNHPALDTKPDKPYYALHDGVLVPVEPRDVGLGALSRSAPWRWSHLTRWVGRTLLVSQEARARVSRGGGMPLDLRVHDPSLPSPWPEAWAVTEALVRQLAGEVDAADARFGVVLFPGQVAGSAAGQRAAVAQWPALAEWDLHRARRKARGVIAPHAPVTDVTDALRAAEASGDPPLYLPQDGHWTAQGHAVAAQAASGAVADWLSSPE